MQAIIITGGQGSRLGIGKNKSFVRVHGSSLLEHHVNNLKPFVNRFIIVDGYYPADVENLDCDYTVITNTQGVVQALAAALEQINSQCVMMFGDEFYVNSRIQNLITEHKNSNSIATIGYCRRNENSYLIHDTYSIDMNLQHQVREVCEKPTIVYNSLQGTGFAVLNKQFTKYCCDDNFPAAINLAIQDNQTVKAFDFCKDYVNVNTPQDLERLRNLEDKSK